MEKLHVHNSHPSFHPKGQVSRMMSGSCFWSHQPCGLCNLVALHSSGKLRYVIATLLYGYDDAKSYYNNVKECTEDGCDGERGKFDCTSIARFQPLSVTDPYIHISTPIHSRNRHFYDLYVVMYIIVLITFSCIN